MICFVRIFDVGYIKDNNLFVLGDVLRFFLVLDLILITEIPMEIEREYYCLKEFCLHFIFDRRRLFPILL